ncbi:hypothetical protein [Vagococcus sp. WN89Y]|uniref:hypothetical protein n=1 Tax=Vagococcus sp. WN89Y TaxID=3457258 RepID=UPI003FCE99E5
MAALPDERAVDIDFGLSVDFLDDDEVAGAVFKSLDAEERAIFRRLRGVISTSAAGSGRFEAVREDGEALTETR